MEIQFKNTKSGLPICSVNGMMLHSLYDPEKEAERVYQAEIPSYVPHYILVVASGLPYYAEKLRKVFPNAQLVSIQFTDAFAGNSIWNDEWNPTVNRTLTQFLDQYINEETAPFLWFTIWPAGQRIWKKESQQCVSAFSELLKIVSSVHATRSYFGKRWLSNMLFNGCLVKNLVQPLRVTEPVVITAAGPTLEQALPFLAEFKPSPYIIAVSSSFAADIAAGLAPDLCISTDGGFYAGEHLASFRRLGNCSTVLAASLEAFLPQNSIVHNSIMLLAYGSPFEQHFFRRLELPSYPTKRNGTVSGTAADVALSITDKNVYAAGLDLMNENGKSHARPNEGAIRRNTSTNRLNPPSGILSATNSALETYAQWFDSRPQTFTNRFFLLNRSARSFKTIETRSFKQCIRDIDQCTCRSPRFSPMSIMSTVQRIGITQQVLSEIAKDIYHISETPTAPYAEMLFNEDSPTGDFIRYTSWQELAQCKHSGIGSSHITAVCASALSTIEKLQQRIKRIADCRQEKTYCE